MFAEGGFAMMDDEQMAMDDEERGKDDEERWGIKTI